MTTQAPHHPYPPGPPQAPPVHRRYARTKATRLLSAGTYLDPGYRRTVIRELLKRRFRVVAPSYGYDAVSVLAHALTARRMLRIQWGTGIGSALVLLALTVGDLLSLWVSALLLCSVLWGATYLRRVVTLNILMTRLKETTPDGGFDGSYPASALLTDALIHKIDREQSTDNGLIFYGGFLPFVGAGEPLRDWSNAQLLLGAPKTRVAARRDYEESRIDLDTVERKPVLPFTVHDITTYVAARMAVELRDEARQDERIEGLTVEQRRFTTAVRTNDRTLGAGWSQLPSTDDLPDVHWREDYDSAREYLCVRVGSWNEELATSVFVGFDLKGDTLHTEFYTYVLGPLLREFHLVDQLPDRFDDRLAVRVAWDMAKATLRWCLALSLFPLWLVPLSRLPAPLRRLIRVRRARRTFFEAVAEGPADSSEFRLGRYANEALDCGALTSVREMATSDTYHHFFQKSDAVKYTQIIERRLLVNIRSFLSEHNVDLAEHDRAQTNILMGDDQSQNFYGGHNENIGYNYQAGGPDSPGSGGGRSS